jgi:formate hydrogenlyase transcriptional activator
VNRARMLNAALDVVRAVATELDEDRLFDALLRTVRQVIPADFVAVATLDRAGTFEVIRVDPARLLLPTIRVHDYPASEAMVTGRAQVMKRALLDKYPLARATWDLHGLQAGLAVPLVAGGETIGGLIFNSKAEDAFDDVDLEIASELGAAVAVVIDSCLARVRLGILRDQQQAENDELSDELRARQSADGMIGDCAAFRSVKQLVDLVGVTDATVLLAGETGTGKDVVARAIHEASARHSRPLVTINCAALPANLAESELFGHEPGAFTGATRRREGCFERAAGGTLFLDEVGELALDIQAKLLRALQERVIERLGGTEPLAVDVRIIAATNRDLSEMVAARQFREDLYYRLAVFPIELPPLRARRDDIPALVEFFVAKAAERLRVPVRAVDASTMARLVAYEWPGNVRELQNAIERAMIISTGTRLEVDALLPAPAVARPRLPPARTLLPTDVGLDSTLRDDYARALAEADWVIEGPTGAAARLGVHPNTLRYRLKRLGLTRPG